MLQLQEIVSQNKLARANPCHRSFSAGKARLDQKVRQGSMVSPLETRLFGNSWMHRFKTRNGTKSQRSPSLAILHLSQRVLICSDDGKKKFLRKIWGRWQKTYLENTPQTVTICDAWPSFVLDWFLFPCLDKTTSSLPWFSWRVPWQLLC